jgi:outer membrane protein assembly factor BamB
VGVPEAVEDAVSAHGPETRRGIAALFALAGALAGVAVACERAAIAQQEDEGDDDEGVPFPPELRRDLGLRRGPAEENRVQIPLSRELEIAVRRADAAAAAGDWRGAARRYLDVLDAERAPADGKQHVAPLGAPPEPPAKEAQPAPVRRVPERCTSYVRLVREKLYVLPEAGRRAFREIADPEAGAIFRAASRDADPERLELVWRTFPVASAADDALELLGDLALEAGDGARAVDRYRRAAALPGGDLDPRRLAQKIAAAERLVALGAARRLGAEEGPAAWPILGGDNAHAAPLPRIPAIARAPRWSRPLPPSRAGESWGVRTSRSGRWVDGVYYGRDDAFAETIPVAADGRLVVVTGRAAICYDLATGDRLWYQAPWAGKEDEKSATLFYSATIAGGRVFAPFISKISNAEYYRGIPIIEDMPQRRLVAFDLETGKRLWDLADSDDPFIKAASFALPPVERDGVLYAGATVRGDWIRTYLVALDAASGRLIWKRFIGAGQVELTMFGEAAIEPLAQMPAEHAGVVYWCNGFGIAAAVAARTGEIEWLARYDAIAIEAAQTFYARERRLVWRNEPPVVVDGVLVATPIDAEKAFGFDAETGERRWELDHGSDRRLLGASGGAVLLQGERVRAIEARTGKLLGVFPKPGEGPALAAELGRGLVSGGAALVPQSLRIQRVEVQAPAAAGPGPELPLPGGARDAGSLLYVGRTLVLVNPQRVTAFDVVEKPGAAPAAPAEGGGGAR